MRKNKIIVPVYTCLFILLSCGKNFNNKNKSSDSVSLGPLTVLTADSVVNISDSVVNTSLTDTLLETPEPNQSEEDSLLWERNKK